MDLIKNYHSRNISAKWRARPALLSPGLRLLNCSHGYLLICLVIIMFIVSCSNEDTQSYGTNQAVDLLNKIEKKCSKLKYDPSDVNRSVILGNCIESFISIIEDIDLLKEIVYLSEKRSKKSDVFLCEELSGEGFYLQVQTEVLYRLANINNKNSHYILVELLIDPNMQWDGEAALNIGGAMVSCGRKALPFYKEKYKINGNPLLKKVIQAIENNEPWP